MKLYVKRVSDCEIIFHTEEEHQAELKNALEFDGFTGTSIVCVIYTDAIITKRQQEHLLIALRESNEQ